MLLLGIKLGIEGQFGHADDAVHRRPDFMAHVGQKRTACPVGGLCRLLGRNQGRLRRLDLADIPLQQQHTTRPGLAVARRDGPAEQEPAPLTIACLQAALGFEGTVLVFEMGIDPGLQNTQVFWMHQALPLGDGIVEVALDITQLCLPLMPRIDVTGRQVPVGQRIARKLGVPAAQIEAGVGAISGIDDTKQPIDTIRQLILTSIPRRLQQLPELRLTFAAKYFLKLFREQPGFHEGLAQAENVLHIEQPVLAPGHEACCPQAAQGIGHTAAGLVRDLDALANTAEHHRVVANNVATAHGSKTDGRRITFAGHALSTVNGAFFKVTPERSGHHLAHAQCRAGRCVDLHAMVGLDDLDVVALIHDACSHIEQLEYHIDADRHVRGEDNRNIPGCRGDGRLAIGFETGRANDHADTGLAAQFEMNQRALRTGEVDQYVDLLEAGCHIVGNQHIGRQANQFAGIFADSRAARHIEGGAEHDALALEDCLDQHAAHAAAGTNNTNTRCAHY